MPVRLDDTDIAIVKSLMEDGRKSFRRISREIKVSTPTVKKRYERLVNIGLIKSVKPEINFSKVESNLTDKFGSTAESLKRQKKHFHVDIAGFNVKLKCEFCGGPIHDKARVLKFANFERFFCCVQCRASYKEKHSGRIEMLKEQYRKR